MKIAERVIFCILTYEDCDQPELWERHDSCPFLPYKHRCRCLCRQWASWLAILLPSPHTSLSAMCVMFNNVEAVYTWSMNVSANLQYHLTRFYVWHDITWLLNRFSYIAARQHCGRSVCPSVVHPSRSGVLSRRMKIRSCGFQHQVGQPF